MHEQGSFVCGVDGQIQQQKDLDRDICSCQVLSVQGQFHVLCCSLVKARSKAVEVSNMVQARSRHSRDLVMKCSVRVEQKAYAFGV